MAGIKLWIKDIDDALAGNPATWDEYDACIKDAVHEFNWHLRVTTHYPTLDWKVIKAMLWVESGAWRSAWKTRPMQIGNPSDKGLDDLLVVRKVQGKLVIPDKFQAGITQSAARSDPETNIRAGIAYLLLQMAKFEERDFVTSGSQVYDVTVGEGDSFSTIAKLEGSVHGVLQKLNPAISPKKLQPGQTIKCQKATRRIVIVGWDPGFNSLTIIANKYNGVGDKGGDRNYTIKLEHIDTPNKLCNFFARHVIMVIWKMN
jgi:hypothetical protein